MTAYQIKSYIYVSKNRVLNSNAIAVRKSCMVGCSLYHDIHPFLFSCSICLNILDWGYPYLTSSILGSYSLPILSTFIFVFGIIHVRLQENMWFSVQHYPPVSTPVSLIRRVTSLNPIIHIKCSFIILHGTKHWKRFSVSHDIMSGQHFCLPLHIPACC